MTIVAVRILSGILTWTVWVAAAFMIAAAFRGKGSEFPISSLLAIVLWVISGFVVWQLIAALVTRMVVPPNATSRED